MVASLAWRGPRRGARWRDRDKNARIGEGARLVNERGIQDVDGDG